MAHPPNCFLVCGILPDHRLNPCSLYWQMDSLPLGYQGSPFYLDILKSVSSHPADHCPRRESHSLVWMTTAAFYQVSLLPDWYSSILSFTQPHFTDTQLLSCFWHSARLASERTKKQQASSPSHQPFLSLSTRNLLASPARLGNYIPFPLQVIFNKNTFSNCQYEIQQVA